MEENAIRKSIEYFDIQGLRLKMTLGQVQKKFNFPDANKIQDELKVISEYEISTRSGTKTVILRFTGEKRLYRIHFINVYKSFKKNPEGLYANLQKKYLSPFLTRKTPGNSDTANIFACWGNACDNPTYTPDAPRLTANIQYLTGKLRLILADHSIHREDWQKYKARREAARLKKRRKNHSSNPQIKLDF